MTKTYLSELEPEQIITLLKQGVKIYEEKSSRWWEWINGVICSGSSGEIRLVNVMLDIKDPSLYVDTYLKKGEEE